MSSRCKMFFSLCAMTGLMAIVPGIASADTFDEGIVYNLGTTVTAGDVVLCENGFTCNTTSTTGWSDVLVFYNSGTGPFLADSGPNANTAYVFSDDNNGGTYGGLTNFIANYNGLSSNAVVIPENPNGPTSYLGGAYIINSVTSPVPEPGTMAPIAGALLAFGAALRRKIAK